jgi:uncharacterized protein YndB with AHSA1/START domain
MAMNLIASATITINAPGARVWDALVNPEAIRQYFFGTNVVTDWQEWSAIIWKGEWQGKTYEDKGMVLENRTGQKIRYSHFSPLSGLPDKPENYHIVTIELSVEGNQTHVSLSQDNNPTEEARAHTVKNWEMVLNGLKRHIEQRRP